MQTALAELSAEQFEQLIERAIDRRFEVWLGQLLDALDGDGEEDSAKLRPEFAQSLKKSIEQAHHGEGLDLRTFREQLTQ